MSLFDAFLEDSLEQSQGSPSTAKEVWFAIRSDVAAGQGTKDDPYNESDQAALDAKLNSLPGDVIIHLGPGIFKTRGGRGTNRQGVIPWEPKSGQRILGSGMFVTTLQLTLNSTNDTTQEAHFFAIGGPNIDFSGYEVSDLTIDCNLGGQPTPTGFAYPKISCGAISLRGYNLKVRRVRVINWGRRGAQWECFPLAISARANPGGPPVPQYNAEEMSNVVEDCIVEQPDWNTGHQASLVTAQVIRNCYIRGDRVRPGPFPQIPLVNLTYVGSRVTVTTPFAHQFMVGDRITVRGVMVGGQLSTLFNGNFPVDAVPSPKTLEYLLGQSGSGTPSGGTVERESKPTLRVKSLTRTLVGSNYEAELETYEAHNRGQDEWIVVSGVLDANGQDDSLYNGVFQIDSLDTENPNKLKYAVGATDPGTATGDIWLDRITAMDVVISQVLKDPLPPQTPDKLLIKTASPHYRAKDDWVQLVGLNPSTLDGYYKVLEDGLSRKEFKVQPASLPDTVSHTAISEVLLNYHQALSGNSRIVERNRVWHCAAGVYHDTWTRPDLVVRHNYFYDVWRAVQEALRDNDAYYLNPDRSGSAEVSGNLVTVTSLKHGLREGALVLIDAPAGYESYEGLFPISLTPIPVAEQKDKFTYTKAGVTPPTAPSLTIVEYFQSWRVIAEKNIIEQALPIKAAQYHPPPYGIPMGGGSFPFYHPDPVLYLQHNLLLRRNLIRLRDGATDPDPDRHDPDKNPFGIFIDGAQNVVMEGNLINVFDVSRRSMLLSYCDVIKTLNNSRFDGTPLRAQRIQYVPSEAELGHVADFLDSLEEAIFLKGIRK
jgi:hypothetical protein